MDYKCCTYATVVPIPLLSFGDTRGRGGGPGAGVFISTRLDTKKREFGLLQCSQDSLSFPRKLKKILSSVSLCKLMYSKEKLLFSRDKSKE